jgi:hypothetical protein
MESTQSAVSRIVNQHTHTHSCEQSAVSKVDQTNSKPNCSVQHKQLSVNVKLCATQHVWSVYRTTALTPSVPHYRPYALCTALTPLRSLYLTTALTLTVPHYRPYALCTSLPPLRSLYRTTTLTPSVRESRRYELRTGVAA